MTLFKHPNFVYCTIIRHSSITAMVSSDFSSVPAFVLAITWVATSVKESAALNFTAEHAPFGTITSDRGECVIGNPDTYISTEDLKWIFDNKVEHDAETYNYWLIDDIVANNGVINYCIRWDNTNTVLTKEVAEKLQPMLARQHAAWNRWLVGYGCWPFEEIEVNVVGFAARDASNLEWSDDSLGKIYIGDLDENGAPQCPHTCYRSPDEYTGGWSESSGCETDPFDVSLWPTEGMGGGMGNYWGMQVDLEDMLGHLDDEELEIVSHEMGHAFSLPDFYKGRPANFKPCIMDAGKSSTVTDTDGWMLRRVLETKRHNYNF
ncbi:hypothetical protein PHMEG_00029248 [Phytophthora megakarya]|uniref:Neutral zinc metallopeptidase n=1 Tax=Phytophthora megakarya TaxID=4795 RepID=A0A225V361_9STRA|nr:hypothetical protein PHMEG_00029248 [Phytophthora megakarya]